MESRLTRVVEIPAFHEIKLIGSVKMEPRSDRQSTTRRNFLRTSVAVGGTAALGSLALSPRVHAAGSDVIRIGLILLGYRIEGETNWHYDQPRQNMYDVEHAELFASIRAGTPIHNGSYMCLSSALAIAAQIACYTGATLTWEDVMNSKRSFALPRYGWDVEPSAKPGPDGRYLAVMQGRAEYEQWRI